MRACVCVCVCVHACMCTCVCVCVCVRGHVSVSAHMYMGVRKHVLLCMCLKTGLFQPHCTESSESDSTNRS